ncbi:hypothetical protein [Serinibacter salmoneus]|uniref:Uncharacterized protein n=1 Tax=Serinibacter salmoneus TaxID=556530 RepID=A0A2A9D216_9MICO|nr:hypothetical protein [Serinibacter salmoneus]PFG20714.1 hypothetical protein ATL40_2324 [Serinibacter salmoneus]
MPRGRWEGERAAWLLAHSRPGTTRRRRAELLSRRARRLARGGAGVGESSLHDDATPTLHRRLMTSDEGPGDRLARAVLVPAGYALVGLLLGGALATAALLYRALWAMAPRVGRLWAWPWIVLGAAGLTAAVMLLDREALIAFDVWPRYMIIDPDFGRIAVVYAADQVSIGLLMLGYYIWAAGWRGVPAGAVRRPETKRDGTFRQTPDRQKVRLDPGAPVTDAVAPTAAAAPVALAVAMATAEPDPDDDPPAAFVDASADPFGDDDPFTSDTDIVQEFDL